ncbi:MAG TPA: class I SAM-dependent methyltransferase [Gemmatimonadales bacterium]|nr:class I SAM-dependent methyltransferase [Gemmatimonadales bacterium]
MKPVSKTAYYCCAVRALDAATASPVCGDTFADRFMTPEAWQTFEPFRDLGPPNASNVARHRMIDDVLRARLAVRPDAGIVILGAGFDTRAFRLTGGRWIELDEPAVIERKEALLPTRDAPNPLTRVSIQFDREPLAAALAPFRDLVEPIVVLEGVLPYLTGTEIAALARTVRAAWPNPTLVCDLMTGTFSRRYGGRIGRRLRELGASWRPFEGEALPLIEAAGFRLETRESVVSYAAARGTVRVPRWLLGTLLRSLRDGYSIASFRPV